MKQYSAENLVIRPGNVADPDVVVEVTPAQAGWDTIHFQVRKLTEGKSWSSMTGADELALVMLGGQVNVDSSRGKWQGVGGRRNVFEGLPHTLYLPRDTQFSLTAVTDCEFAVARAAATDEVFAPKLVTPARVSVEIRGGDHATRHINRMLPPGFPCSRLVVVEVYTPGGNWSSYPPHKHDALKIGPEGYVLEADLDEIYYYKLDRPEGFAIQRVYTGKDSPLQLAGKGFDAALVVHDNDVVLVPAGNHPVTCPPGYTSYYLNILAGSHQSLAAIDDPDFTWVKDTYQALDPRCPIYPIEP